MSLRINLGWLLTTLLVSIRIASATMLAPVFGPTNVPAPARVMLILGLSAFVVAGTPVQALPTFDLVTLAIAAAAEVATGLSFAFGFLAAYAATQFAGRALDIQVGFGAAGVLNPATQTYSPLFGSVFGMLAIAVFLAMDGHHVLLRALVASISAAPPGAVASFVDPAQLLQQSALMFTFGLALAGPVMFTLLLSDVAMAVFARSMPQLNVFVLGFAIKIVLGLLGIAITVKFASVLFGDLFAATFRYWEAVASPR